MGLYSRTPGRQYALPQNNGRCERRFRQRYNRRHDRANRVSAERNIIAGFLKDYQFTEEALQLQHGDTLLLYTDGVTEAVDPDYNEYGEERLEALLKNTSQVDCQQLIDAVKADVKVFANGAEQSDDITLLAIKRH